MNQSKNSGGNIFTVNMKSMQFILPISMLSFLFSQSPGFDGLLDFLQIYGFDSTCTASIRAKKAYVFLFFNGLLALLINNSGALKTVPEIITKSLKTAPEIIAKSLKTAIIKTTVCDDIEEEEEEDDDIVADRVTEQILAGSHEKCQENNDDIVADHVITEQVVAGDHDEEYEETEEYDECDVLADDEEDEDEDDRCDELALSDESDEEDTGEVVVWGISVEELNSKCDDFIKNMRHML